MNGEDSQGLLASRSLPSLTDPLRHEESSSHEQGSRIPRRRGQRAFSSLANLAALEVQEHMGLGGGSLVADDDEYMENERYSYSIYRFEKRPLLKHDDALAITEVSEFGEHYEGSGLVRTAVTYVKGMVGTYILYLPHLFALGGAVTSSFTLILLAVLSTFSMLLLLDCRSPDIHSFGEVGYKAYGFIGKTAVEVSLVLTQLGFCATYYIFVSENLGLLLGWSTMKSILIQFLLYAPFACVRRLKLLGAGMFVANIFLAVGISIVLWEIYKQFSQNGIHDGIELANPSDTFMVIGSILCAFEGIGLVFPIQDAMENHLKPKFGKLLCFCMFGVSTIFLLFALAGYLAFGPDVPEFVTMEIPIESAEGIIVRLLYSFGILLTFPLQLFPAVKIIERVIFSPLSTTNITKYRRKWSKNFVRMTICALVAIAALVGGYAFDVFVALVGAICSVPLALVYPPLFHLKLKHDITTTAKVLDYLLIFFGTAGVFLATGTSLASL